MEARALRRGGRLTGLALILCLTLGCLAPARPAAGAAPVLLVGAPQNDQLSRFTEQVAAAMTPMPNVRYVPGLGGAYALRDAASNPTAVAVFVLPAFILLRDEPNSPYYKGNLEPFALAARMPVALWVPESSPIKALPELITLARHGAGTVLCAGPGRFTAPHLASVVFNREAGIQTLFLPLIGTDEARKAALEGRVQAVWAYALPPGSLPGLRPLAVAAEARSPALPDTPTFAEYGQAVTIAAELGFALSPQFKDKPGITAALRAALADSYTADALARQGFAPLSTEGEALPLYLDEQARRLEAFKIDFPHLQD